MFKSHGHSPTIPNGKYTAVLFCDHLQLRRAARSLPEPRACCVPTRAVPPQRRTAATAPRRCLSLAPSAPHQPPRAAFHRQTTRLGVTAAGPCSRNATVPRVITTTLHSRGAGGTAKHALALETSRPRRRQTQKKRHFGQPLWRSGLAPSAAQGMILETLDRVPRQALCVTPASPSASLCVSMNK